MLVLRVLRIRGDLRRIVEVLVRLVPALVLVLVLLGLLGVCPHRLPRVYTTRSESESAKGREKGKEKEKGKERGNANRLSRKRR